MSEAEKEVPTENIPDVVPADNVQADGPPASTQEDVPPANIEKEVPPTSTQVDVTPANTQEKVPPTSTPVDVAPTNTQENIPPDNILEHVLEEDVQTDPQVVLTSEVDYDDEELEEVEYVEECDECEKEVEEEEEEEQEVQDTVQYKPRIKPKLPGPPELMHFLFGWEMLNATTASTFREDHKADVIIALIHFTLIKHTRARCIALGKAKPEEGIMSEVLPDKWNLQDDGEYHIWYGFFDKKYMLQGDMTGRCLTVTIQNLDDLKVSRLVLTPQEVVRQIHGTIFEMVPSVGVLINRICIELLDPVFGRCHSKDVGTQTTLLGYSSGCPGARTWRPGSYMPQLECVQVALPRVHVTDHHPFKVENHSDSDFSNFEKSSPSSTVYGGTR